MIKNKTAVLAKLSLWAKAPGLIAVADFRRIVRAVFHEIVDTTPQFTGKAAANWNIGLGAPDFTVDQGVGEMPELVKSKAGNTYADLRARQVGDRKWAEFAKEMNEYKIRKIQLGTSVFISNGVTGDIDRSHPGTSVNYLADLQNPGYWAQRLRSVNQPYETVSHVLLMESWRLRLPERLVGESFLS